jgi:hypothetical protein
MLNSHDPDECCAPHLSKALHDGEFDEAASWICPDCGMEWRPTEIPGIGFRHWVPHCPVAVL